MIKFALGMMSGTSADGVSVALAEFPASGRFNLIKHHTYPFSKTFSRKIKNAARLDAAGISGLNFELGKIFGDYAVSFLKANKIKSRDVSVIGSHGQTLFHNPRGKPPSTFQIGESSLIAEKTGITVVSDFRQRDIAAGGEGAPLIPFFDQRFFGIGPARLLLNIGGISNISVVGRGIRFPLAFDTGPGNCLMDQAVAEISKGRKSCDAGGLYAKKGKIDLTAVRATLNYPYFSKKPPKSTGPELFNLMNLPRKFRTRLNAKPYGFLSTLNYFTARSIFEAHQKFVLPRHKIHEVIVSGGGVYNLTLMDHLRALFAPVLVRPISDFGIDPQAKEPLAFAFFAWEAVCGRINHLPEGTGAKGARILGKITPGIGFKGLR